jgi:hypothetical protein
MAIQYNTAVQIRAWTNPKYSLNKRYNVYPYVAGNKVTAYQLEAVSEDEANDHFQKLLDMVRTGTMFDQIEITEEIIKLPAE